MIAQYLQDARPRRSKGDGAKLYDCPICLGRGKLEVHASKPMWYCHKCGRGGTTRGVIVQKDEWVDRVHLHDDLLERYHAIEFDHPLMLRLSRQRYTRKGFLSVRLKPHSGPDPYRIYFPCFDLGSGIPCMFVGRLLTAGEPKYLNPKIGEGGRISETAWGLHRLRTPVRNLTIVEGVFDSVHYPNTIALLGSTISDAQCEIVRAVAPQSVTIWLDEDAKEKQAKVVEKLSRHVSFPISTIPWSVIRDRPRYRREKERLDPDLVRDPSLLKLRERIV